MAFSCAAPLAALVALIDSLAVVDETDTGIPKAVTNRVTASVSIGGMSNNEATIGLLEREVRYFVLFVVRVDNDPAAAEATLAAYLDQFVTALYSPSNRSLGGTAKKVSIDSSLARSPEYMPMVGQEVRLYPLEVVTSQRINP